jgi:hypothetical protein
MTQRERYLLLALVVLVFVAFALLYNLDSVS